jgi:hypothetical protein
MELTVRVHFEDGAYWAEVLELPGCFASGKTLDDVKDASTRRSRCTSRTTRPRLAPICSRPCGKAPVEPFGSTR